MQILIIEDEQRLAMALQQILREQKYQVEMIDNGNDGLLYALENPYDLIILDIMLPGKNGYEIASLLRKQQIKTPILMLTAKDSISSKVQGLDSGADDYMTKPFATEEFLARVRALSRRQSELIPEELHFEDLTYAISSSILSCKEKQVRLNFKESETLKLLLAKPAFLLSKGEIINKVWGYDSNATDNNVEAYISFLRKKIAFIGSRVTIISVKKQGYKLECHRC